MKLGTFFSGIGAVEKALKNIGINYELQFFSEIDKYAIRSYIEIHNEPIEKNIGDISKLKGKDLPYCDMWFGGFPCQDISLAGKLAGFEENTRSSLGWEMIRLASEVEEKPKYILFENVKNITSKRFIKTLDLFKKDLEDLGYTLFDEVLNAREHGIPQNRERYFLIASLEKIDYKFPEKEELKLKLRDLLEDEVDEKFYLSDKIIDCLTGVNQKESKFPRGERFKQTLEKTNIEDIAVSITTVANGNNLGVVVKNLKIRKLTPKECFRLMDFTDEDFEKAQAVNSNTQLYKQARNSIVVRVLEKILVNLLKGGLGMKELEKIQEQLKRIRYRLDKCYEANQNMLVNLTIAHELIEKIQEEI